MMRETEQMAAIADARQGSTPSGRPQMSVEQLVEAMANTANNTLAHALDQVNAALSAVETAALEQRHAVLALAAVTADPNHHEVRRGQVLRERAERLKS